MSSGDRSRISWSDYEALDHRVWLVAAARAANTMGLSLVMAFMAVYLVSERGLTGTTTGIVYAVANILQAVAQAYAGELSDRTGRKRTMVIALLARSILIASLGAAVLSRAPVWTIAVLLNLSWFVRGWFEPVAYAAVADVAPAEQHVPAFALQKMGVNVGWAAGPILGGFLIGLIDYGWVFFCAAPIILATAVAMSTMKEPDHVDRPARTSVADGLRALRGDHVASLFIALGLLSGLVHAQLFSTFSVYVVEGLGLSEARLGQLWTINAAVVLTMQLAIVAFIQRIGTGRALVLGAGLFGCAFAALGVHTSYAVLVVAIAAWSCGEIIHDPAQQGVAAELAQRGRMGRAMGLLGMARTAGGAFSMLAGGAAFDAFRGNPQAMWIVLAGLPIALTAGYALLVAFRNKTETPAT